MEKFSDAEKTETFRSKVDRVKDNCDAHRGDRSTDKDPSDGDWPVRAQREATLLGT